MQRAIVLSNHSQREQLREAILPYRSYLLNNKSGKNILSKIEDSSCFVLDHYTEGASSLL